MRSLPVRKSTRSVQLTILFNAAILVFGGLGCWWGGIRGVYLGSVPATTGLIAITWLVLRSRLKVPRASRSNAIWAELKTHREFLPATISIYLAVASLSGLMLVARYLAMARLGAEAAGHFQACLAIALFIGAVLGPASNLYLTPYLNRSILAAEKAEAVGRFLPRLIILSCLGALIILPFPEPLLRILFSARFTPAAGVLPLFVIWQFINQVCNVHQQLLIGLDDLRGYCFGTVLGSVAAAIGCFGLIGPLGLSGIGVGFIAGTLVSFALTTIRLQSRHQQSPFTRSLLLTAISVLGFVVVTALLTAGDEPTSRGLSSRALFALGFVAILWFTLPAELRLGISGTLSAHFGHKHSTGE